MGLKLTMGPYVVALGALIVLMVLARQVRVGAGLAFLAGTVLGFAAFGGAWCWRLWERFGNPLFPFANQVFRSPYLPAEAIRDPRWVAQGPLDLLATPWAMALGETSRLQEIPFRDARFLLVLVAASGGSPCEWLGREDAAAAGPAQPVGLRPGGLRGLDGRLLLLPLRGRSWSSSPRWSSSSWCRPCFREWVGPCSSPRARTCCCSRASAPGSVKHWSDRWWRVTIPAQAYERDSLVLLTSPLNSYLVPFFPEETRFVGLEWVGSSRFDDLVTATLGSHKGTLMVLASIDEHLATDSLKRYALTVTDDCGVVRTGSGRKHLCRVVRTTGAPPRVSPLIPH